MIRSWRDCKNILCIRADNMGDLIMSSPAIRALKESFQSKITVLTSSLAAGIAAHISEIDDVIIYDLPWVKANEPVRTTEFFDIVEEIKKRKFDGVIIFSVYSQNPLPAAMLAYLAEIPLRLAYCRENPYELLTNWVPDKEPYTEIKHQVIRDLDLVKTIGAETNNDRLSLSVPDKSIFLTKKLLAAGVNLEEPWLIVHAGVSEKKRQFPLEKWIEASKRIINNRGYQVLFTGGGSEKRLTDHLQKTTGTRSFSLGGLFDLDEFISLIKMAPLVISVNTGTVHIAAAVNTPVLVLYALTNPQHFPWRAKGKVLLYDVPADLKSYNEVISYVDETHFGNSKNDIQPGDILNAARKILNGDMEFIPELPDLYFSVVK